MRKLRNYLIATLLEISTFVNPIRDRVVAQESSEVKHVEEGEKTYSLEEIIAQAKIMQTNEEFVKKNGNFYLCKKDPKEIDKFSILFGEDICPNCPSSQKAFGELYGRKYEQRGDICFFASEEAYKDPDMIQFRERAGITNEAAIKLREKAGITSFPNWANFKREKKGEDKWEIVGMGDEDSNLDEFGRSVDLEFCGVIRKSGLRNPAVFVYSLMYGVDPANFSYNASKDAICVEYDLTDSEEVKLALRFDSENCGKQRKMFEKAIMEARDKARRGGGLKFDKDVIRALTNKYCHKRLGEVDDPEKQFNLLFSGEGDKNNPSLWDVLHDGVGCIKDPNRETKFNEDEINDREKFYDTISGSLDQLMPEPERSIWRLYVDNARKKFDGKASEYVFIREEANETFIKHMTRWVDNKPKDERPRVRLISFSSNSEIDQALGRLKIKEETQKRYKESINELIEGEKDYYRGSKEGRIILVSNEAPKEVFWNMTGENDFLVIARHLGREHKALGSRMLYNDLVLFAEKNKEKIDKGKVGVYILDGIPYSVGFVPPLRAGIDQVVAPYLAYNGLPSAAVFRNDNRRIKQINSSFTFGAWLEIPER